MVERKSEVLEPKDVLIGTQIGNCRIVKKIGAGGMGTVYRAEHAGLGKSVAVKVLGRQLMGSEEAVARFLREARTAAKIDHPNVVQVHDVGTAGDFHYIVMQFVEGRSLEAILKERKSLPVAQALAITRAVASGLGAAHKLGVVHRDIKPGNIIITTEGRVKVADFGLARDGEAGKSVSTTGQILGTPAYMSPEQAEGLATDARSDLYSLGATLYHLATGARCFEGGTPLSIVIRQTKDEPERAERINGDIPPAVGDLIRGMMRKKPAERPQSAEEVIRLIDALGKGRPAANRSKSPIVFAIAAALLIVAGAVAWAILPGAPPAVPPPAPAPAPKPAPPPLPPPVRTTAHGVKILGMDEAIAKVADEKERAMAAELSKTVEAFWDAAGQKDMEKMKLYFEGGEGHAKETIERQGAVPRFAKDKLLTVTQVEITAFAFEQRGGRQVIETQGRLTVAGMGEMTTTMPLRNQGWTKKGEKWIVAARR